jgi:O-antigen ligase
MRILIVLATGIVLLLLQSVFWPAGESFWMKAIIVGVAVLSFCRPRNGFLVLAALAPFGQLIRGLLGSDVRGGEGLVLAFLAGAVMNGWTLGEFRSIRWTRLKVAVVIFAAIVVTSCIEQLWFSQLQTEYAPRFIANLARYLSSGYLTSLRGYGEVFNAMLFVEGLCLLLYGVRFCQTDRNFAPQVVRMLIIGAVGGAVVNLAFAIGEIAETGEPAGRYAALFITQRWSAMVGDVNSAGSFFAMTAAIAIGMAVTDRTRWIMWLSAGLLLSLALLMTVSRSALVAALVVAAGWLVRITVIQKARVRWAAKAALAVLVVSPIAAIPYLRDTPLMTTAAYALNIRWMLLETTWRMLEWQPLFGVGVGQYFLWSGRFSSPQLRVRYPHENAHNNFAQVAGELGLIGLVAFVSILVICLVSAKWKNRSVNVTIPESPQDYVAPVVAGLVAFMLSWLGGHPLLVAEVAYPFWIILALIPGLAMAARPVQRKYLVLAGYAAIALAASLPLRVTDKLAAVDLSRLKYGFVPLTRNQDSNWPSRINARARIFVPVYARDVSIRLRSPSASFDDSEEVLIRVNGEVADRVRLSDPSWQVARIALPFLPNRRYHRVDFEVAGRANVEVGGWEIISAPDG